MLCSAYGEGETSPSRSQRNEPFVANSCFSFWKPSDVSKPPRAPPLPTSPHPRTCQGRSQSRASQCPLLPHYTASLRCEVSICPVARCPESAVSTRGLMSHPRTSKDKLVDLKTPGCLGCYTACGHLKPRLGTHQPSAVLALGLYLSR